MECEGCVAWRKAAEDARAEAARFVLDVKDKDAVSSAYTGAAPPGRTLLWTARSVWT